MITFEDDITSTPAHKPTAFSGQKFPYPSLPDSKQFEELLFALYKQEIKSGRLTTFDQIGLMSGVREKGRDVTLYRDNKIHGIIQTKKYKERLGKQELGEEIVKYVLNALLDKRLMREPADFTYYIAAAGDFTTDTVDWISTVNGSIDNEPALDKWIAANCKKPTLRSFQASIVRPQVVDILRQIKVEAINPTDLDMMMVHQGNQAIIDLFFEIRKVTDNSHVLDIKQTLNNLLAPPQLSEDDLHSELERGSRGLQVQKNEFEGIDDSHIARQETAQLLTWIKAPLPLNRKNGLPENILLLAGNAGMGKTVIMKDTLDTLQKENIPVLAIKADKFYAASLPELSGTINLKLPVTELIDACKQAFGQVILLIDQIDALSQSLSADRRFLSTYTQLVDTYKHDPRVRIIISVRLFDLYYDSHLKLYKNIRNITVKPLSKEEVLLVLQKRGISKHAVSEQLVELLRVPNTLDVFARIYRPSMNFSGIISIQAIYAELWKQKITDSDLIDPSKKQQVTTLLKTMAQSMYEEQRITLHANRFDAYTEAISYLVSQDIIREQSGQLQFFHQSFYDYVFARHFVEDGQSITQFLRKEKQSIMARPAVKMIINYLRDYDHAGYIRQSQALLTAGWVSFQVRHLLISLLATRETSTAEELTLVKEHLLPQPLASEVFIEQVISKVWIEELISGRAFERLLQEPKAPGRIRSALATWFRRMGTRRKMQQWQRQDIVLQTFRKNMHTAQESIIAFLMERDYPSITSTILFNIRQWTPSALALFEKNQRNFDQNYPMLVRLLGDIATEHPAYAFDTFLAETKKRGLNWINQHNYQENEVLEKAAAAMPECICDEIYRELVADIESRDYSRVTTHIVPDHTLEYMDLATGDDRRGREFCYHLLASTLREKAAVDDPYFHQFWKANSRSRYRSVLLLLVYILTSNEEKRAKEIFELFEYIADSRFLGCQEKFNFEFRKLLKAAYPHFSEEQRKLVIRTIKTLEVPDEIYLLTHAAEKHRIARHGLTKHFYLGILPAEVIQADTELKRSRQELHRKYEKVQDDPGSRSWGGTVTAPLSAKAYENMNTEQWLESFRKYHSDDRWDKAEINEGDFLKGGRSEHAIAFQNEAQKYPDKFLDMIDGLIDTTDIHINYAVAGIEGVHKTEKYSDWVVAWIERLAEKSLDLSGILKVLRMIRSIAQAGKMTDALFNFLREQLRHHPDPAPAKINEDDKTGVDWVNGGLNSVRGVAANALAHIDQKEFTGRVFDLVQHIFDNDNNVVKAALLLDYAHLGHLDEDREFEVFVKAMTDPKNVELATAGLNSAQYLMHKDFEGLLPYWEILLRSKDLKEHDKERCALIFLRAWLKNYPHGERLYKEFMKTCEDIQEKMVRVLFNWLNTDIHKCIEALDMLTIKENVEVAKQFSVQWLHMENVPFETILPFLRRLVVSKVFIFNDYFMEYLTDNCAKYPCETLDLFAVALKNGQVPNKQENRLLRCENNAAKFVVGAFTALEPRQNKLHGKYQRRALKIFDEVLMDARFRGDAEKVLDDVVK